MRKFIYYCYNGGCFHYDWGLYGPKVARLAAKQQTGVAPFGRYITAHGPSMARLHIAARAIVYCYTTITTTAADTTTAASGVNLV